MLALAYNGSKDSVIFPFINVLRTVILMGNSSQHLIERIRINHGPKYFRTKFWYALWKDKDFDIASFFHYSIKIYHFQ